MNAATSPSAPTAADDQLRLLCEGWLCHELSEEQKATFVDLLRTDPQAGARLASYLEEWHLFASVAHQQQVAAGLGDNRARAAPLSGPGNRAHSPWAWVSAAAAAVAAAVLWLALPPATARHSEAVAAVTTEPAPILEQRSMVLRPQANHSNVTLVHDLGSNRRVMVSVRHNQQQPPQH